MYGLFGVAPNIYAPITINMITIIANTAHTAGTENERAAYTITKYGII